MPGSPNVRKGIIRSNDLLQVLREDVDAAYSILEGDRNSQYLRRCAVRAVFSYIEAMIECIKIEVRSSIRLQQYTGVLTDKELETLGSTSIFAVRNSKFLPLDQNIKKTFKLASKVWGLKFKLATDGEDFRDFLAAKSARNRLTHPKTFYDVEVTDGDMHCHSISGVWVEHEFQRLFKTRIESLLEGLPVEERRAFHEQTFE